MLQIVSIAISFSNKIKKWQTIESRNDGKLNLFFFIAISRSKEIDEEEEAAAKVHVTRCGPKSIQTWVIDVHNLKIFSRLDFDIYGVKLRRCWIRELVKYWIYEHFEVMQFYMIKRGFFQLLIIKFSL